MAGIVAVNGNVNLAMLLAMVIAMLTLFKQRALNREQMSQLVETSLMSGGMIILITAAGGAFGAMLQEAELIPPSAGTLLKLQKTLEPLICTNPH